MINTLFYSGQVWSFHSRKKNTSIKIPNWLPLIGWICFGCSQHCRITPNGVPLSSEWPLVRLETDATAGVWDQMRVASLWHWKTAGFRVELLLGCVFPLPNRKCPFLVHISPSLFNNVASCWCEGTGMAARHLLSPFCTELCLSVCLHHRKMAKQQLCFGDSPQQTRVFAPPDSFCLALSSIPFPLCHQAATVCINSRFVSVTHSPRF